MRQHISLIALAVFGAAPAAAYARGTPDEVLERHMAALKNGDVDGLMADYADNVVIVGRAGVSVGTAETRKLMSSLAAMKDVFGAMEVRSERVGDDIVMEHFVINRGTPQEVSGTDVFVVRNGKIVFQALRPQAAAR